MCDLKKSKYEKDFEESYKKAIKTQPINHPKYYPNNITYQEDYDEDDIEDAKEENQLTPEDEAVMELELGLNVSPKGNEVVRRGIQCIPLTHPEQTHPGFFSSFKKPTIAMIIQSINDNRAIKEEIMRDLGITRKYLKFVFKKYSGVAEEYNRVRAIYHKAGPKVKRPDNHTIIEALHKNRANVAAAASDLKMSFTYLSQIINKIPALREGMASARRFKLDITLQKQDELVDGVMVLEHDFKGNPVVYKVTPNPVAIKNVMKAEGKELGYGDSIDKNVKVTVDPITFNYIAPVAPPRLQIEAHHDDDIIDNEPD